MGDVVMDNRIEAVAKHICARLGLDPEKIVPTSPWDVRTPLERSTYFVDGACIPDIMLMAPIWMTYRAKAAEAIAASQAVRDVA